MRDRSRSLEGFPTDGTVIELWIPLTTELRAFGFWSSKWSCFRYLGDDGPQDIQPHRWAPIPTQEEIEGGR